jgi:hypothetical protein
MKSDTWMVFLLGVFPATAASTQTYANKRWLHSDRPSVVNKEGAPGSSLPGGNRVLNQNADDTGIGQQDDEAEDDVPPFCNEDGTVDFSNMDSFNEDAFKSKFAPICSCVDEDNTKDVVGRIEELLGEEQARTSVLYERMQDEIGTIYGEQSYECINQCEVCFKSSDGKVAEKCGIADSTYKLTYGAIDSGTILEKVKAGTLDSLMGEKSLEEHIQSKFHFDFCFLYTVGEEGKVCFGTNPNGPSDAKVAMEECFVSYNGDLCSSCVRGGLNATEGSCIQANCTNIAGGGLVDSCVKETTVGPFEILSQYQKRTAPLTLGACGDIQKVANHPTVAPAEDEEEGVGYADASTMRVSGSQPVHEVWESSYWISLLVIGIVYSLV